MQSLKTKNLRWLSTFSSLKYLDLSCVSLLDPKEWFSSINMLSSLEFLILRGCSLDDAWASLHVNFTSLRFLDLSQNLINSSIPPWFQNFSKLGHLDIGDNDLHGIFPTAILQNSRWLTFLDVSLNRLEGELLKNMSIFCNLQELRLSSNKFSGRISDTKDDTLTCGQSNLKTIVASVNNFTGRLPNQLENFKDLEYLRLSRNSISGSIPATVDQLSSLRGLYLSDNKLSGNIPKSIGQLSNLESMIISSNQLDGVLNEFHFANLSSLIEFFFASNELVINVSTSWVPPFQIQEIDMSSCKVGPQFPNWLRTQRNISALYMQNASISDEVPHWLFEILSNVDTLDFSGNKIRGNISQIIGEKMPQLREVSLSGNNLSGGIPNSLCMSDELSFLDLSNNHLSGRIPRCWKNWQMNLRSIYLGENELNGSIPNSLCHLEGLRFLDLHENGLRGVLPKCLLKLDLEILDLSDNQLTGRMLPFGRQYLSFAVINLERNYFTGDIPLQLCHLALLQYLSLADNNISGGIPHCFNNFSSMWTNYTYFPNFIIGVAYSLTVTMKGTSLEFTKTLPYLFSIDLSSNALQGQIPEGLTTLGRLRNLNLSRNRLIGKIPSNIGDLRDVESLDLSNNELSGEIPPSISNLDSLSHLDLSFNNLSGPVPSGNHLSTIEDRSVFRGNDGLCGALLSKICPGDEHKDMGRQDGHDSSEYESKDNSVVVWFYSGLGPGFLVAFLGFCGILHFKQSWRISYFRVVDRIIEKLSMARMITMLWFKRAFRF